MGWCVRSLLSNRRSLFEHGSRHFLNCTRKADRPRVMSPYTTSRVIFYVKMADNMCIWGTSTILCWVWPRRQVRPSQRNPGKSGDPVLWAVRGRFYRRKFGGGTVSWRPEKTATRIVNSGMAIACSAAQRTNSRVGVAELRAARGSELRDLPCDGAPTQSHRLRL